MRFIYSLTCVCILSFFFACATSPGEYRSEARLIEKEGKTGKKSVAVLTIKKGTKNEDIAEFSSPFFPAIVIKGDIEKQKEGFSFYITHARLFSGWPNGWTDGLYEASGKLKFMEQDDMIQCYMEDAFELWDIIDGEIRYYNKYYRHEDGLWKVKNRVDRDIEISRFLQEINNIPLYGDLKKKTTYSPGFKSDITRILFPERADFKKLEKMESLPDIYYKHNGEYQKKIVWGADLGWRTDYTRAVFPEYLWQLRDSGTLWRDFEEAPMLLYSLYNLNYFFNTLLKDTQFIKIK